MNPLSVVVLLTATVDPRGMVRTVIAEPDTRLREYHAVIRDVVAQLPGVPIVVCDNSGWGVGNATRGERTASWPDQVEFVTFDDHQEAIRRGKGYGEIGIIEYVVQHVPAVRAADLVVKITGRLRVANVGTLVRRVTAGGPADVVVDLLANLTQADCRFFVASPHFLRDYLVPMRESIDDDHGVCLEHVLARTVHRAMADGLVWRPLPDVPVITGRSGTTGYTYGSGKARVLARRLRRLMHRWSEARPLIH